MALPQELEALLEARPEVLRAVSQERADVLVEDAVFGRVEPPILAVDSPEALVPPDPERPLGIGRDEARLLKVRVSLAT
jgi:hypothetical protein